MPKAKYATPEHRKVVAQYRRLVDAGQGWCAEPICLEDTRYIQPGSPLDAAHDPTGTQYIGPAHPRCNRSEGATRGNRQRAPHAANRWVL